jgi:hypothetical protein
MSRVGLASLGDDEDMGTRAVGAVLGTMLLVTGCSGTDETTQKLLSRAGVDSRLETNPGEQHAFGPQWPLSMERTVRFLRRQLRG